jgi:AcrR family transcriptional regulator
MSRSGRPRVHTHLSRESIARAGLEIVDRRGLDALSLRAVAEALGVGTMTLYAHTPDREALERDIIGLLLDEVDVREVPGEEWDDSIRRVAGSLREMTLRHPRAFPLVAAAPVFESPVLEYAARIRALHARQKISQERFVAMWSVCDAFLTGFMVMLAQAAVRAGEAALPIAGSPKSASAGPGAAAATTEDHALAAGLADVLSEEAFARDLEVVLAGLRASGLAVRGA